MPTIDKTLNDEDVAEPTIIAIAGCKQDTVRINLSDDFEKEVNKNDFGVFVVLWDFLVIIILVWFVNFLNKRQMEYSKKFEDETIEMTDFCMRFGNLPKNKFFKGNQKVLKTILWDKFT